MQLLGGAARRARAGIASTLYAAGRTGRAAAGSPHFAAGAVRGAGGGTRGGTGAGIHAAVCGVSAGSVDIVVIHAVRSDILFSVRRYLACVSGGVC